MVQLSNAVFAAFIQLALSAQISTGLPTRPLKDVTDPPMLLNERKEHELFKRVAPMAAPFIALGTFLTIGGVATAIAACTRKSRQASCQRLRSTDIPLQGRRRTGTSTAPPPSYPDAVQAGAVLVPPPPAHVRFRSPPPSYAPPSYEAATGGNTARSPEPARLHHRKRSDIAGIVDAKKRSDAVNTRGSINDLD